MTAKRRDLEGQLCIDFFRIAENLHHLIKYPDAFCLYKIVNEQIDYGNEHIRMKIGAKLKRQGRLAGVWDYKVEWFDGNQMRFAYLEAKVPPNGLSDTQKQFKARLERYSIPHCIFRTPMEGIEFISSLGVYKFSLDNINEAHISLS